MTTLILNNPESEEGQRRRKSRRAKKRRSRKKRKSIKNTNKTSSESTSIETDLDQETKRSIKSIREYKVLIVNDAITLFIIL